ncbi:MAG: SatD family protein [Planctomycetaceae bacterium]
MARKRIHWILMADVIGSRSRSGETVSRQLQKLVAAANEQDGVLSPLVVTLGDEFQGVLTDLGAACDLILFLEQEFLRRKIHFQLRYSLYEGMIDTPVNRERAHGMLGPGLTAARELLNDKRPGSPRIRVSIQNAEVGSALQDLFSVMTALKERWNVRDYELILAMLANRNDAEVAEVFDKNRSQIWKRRNTLLVNEYLAVKRVINQLSRYALS